jgi:hypothetical protein
MKSSVSISIATRKLISHAPRSIHLEIVTRSPDFHAERVMLAQHYSEEQTS